MNTIENRPTTDLLADVSGQALLRRVEEKLRRQKLPSPTVARRAKGSYAVFYPTMERLVLGERWNRRDVVKFLVGEGLWESCEVGDVVFRRLESALNDWIRTVHKHPELRTWRPAGATVENSKG